jgi:hypothetical protein
VEQVFLRGLPGSQARNFVFENKLLPFEQRDTNVVLVGMGELGPEHDVSAQAERYANFASYADTSVCYAD